MHDVQSRAAVPRQRRSVLERRVASLGEVRSQHDFFRRQTASSTLSKVRIKYGAARGSHPLANDATSGFQVAGNRRTSSNRLVVAVAGKDDFLAFGEAAIHERCQPILRTKGGSTPSSRPGKISP